MCTITYLYILLAQRFYVAKVVFQCLLYSWHTALFTSTTIATLSTKGMFSSSSFISSWPVSTMEKYWARICTAAVYTTRCRKLRFLFALGVVVDVHCCWFFFVCLFFLLIRTCFLFRGILFHLVTNTLTWQGFSAEVHRFTLKCRWPVGGVGVDGTK